MSFLQGMREDFPSSLPTICVMLLLEENDHTYSPSPVGLSYCDRALGVCHLLTPVQRQSVYRRLTVSQESLVFGNRCVLEDVYQEWWTPIRASGAGHSYRDSAL